MAAAAPHHLFVTERRLGLTTVQYNVLLKNLIDHDRSQLLAGNRPSPTYRYGESVLVPVLLHLVRGVDLERACETADVPCDNLTPATVSDCCLLILNHTSPTLNFALADLMRSCEQGSWVQFQMQGIAGYIDIIEVPLFNDVDATMSMALASDNKFRPIVKLFIIFDFRGRVIYHQVFPGGTTDQECLTTSQFYQDNMADGKTLGRFACRKWDGWINATLLCKFQIDHPNILYTERHPDKNNYYVASTARSLIAGKSGKRILRAFEILSSGKLLFSQKDEVIGACLKLHEAKQKHFLEIKNFDCRPGECVCYPRNFEVEYRTNSFDSVDSIFDHFNRCTPFQGQPRTRRRMVDVMAERRGIMATPNEVVDALVAGILGAVPNADLHLVAGLVGHVAEKMFPDPTATTNTPAWVTDTTNMQNIMRMGIHRRRQNPAQPQQPRVLQCPCTRAPVQRPNVNEGEEVNQV